MSKKDRGKERQESKQPELEDLIQVRLGRLIDIIAQFTKQSTQAHGLRNTDLRILNILDGSDGVSVNELARRAHIDKAWVSRSLRELEKNDMVSRSPDPEDLRRQVISLTKKSNGMIEAVRPLITQREQRLLEGIDGQSLKKQLDSLMINAEKILDEIKKN